MKDVFYFLFGWLIGSGSGDEVVEIVTTVPEAAVETTTNAGQAVCSTPWLLVPLIIMIISMGIGVFSRFITDNKDDGRG